MLAAMYNKLFGLKREPFSIAPDPRFLYMSERHREALAHLLYGVRSGGGFVLLSGAIGAGKTTVCRCFLEQVPKSCNVAYIFNPKLTVGELLATVCEEFGIADADTGAASVKQQVDALNKFLLNSHALGMSSVLIIDEAQMLSADVLEQLRLLTNLETNQRKLLQIILIGQPELRALLALPQMEQLAQRVIARYHLDALSERETARYVRHRLAVAGLSGPLPFSVRAMRRIHQATGGVPRRINLLCDRAMLGAYGEGRTRIDQAMIDAAAREVFDPRSSRSRRWLPWTAAAAAVALLGIALTLLLRRDDRPPAVAVAAAASAPASAAAPSASAAAALATVPPAAGAASALLSAAEFAERKPWPDEADAWRALGRRWQLDIAADQPCRAVETLGLSCYQGSATLGMLRQLDRPVLLKLSGGNRGDPAWAMLSALNGERATLALADGTAEVSLATLTARWRGDFATLWRRPPGLGADADFSRVDYGSGALGDWLKQRLADFQGDALPATATLRQRIEAFQLAQGLTPDGQVGPMTLMQLDRVGGDSAPRLEGG